MASKELVDSLNALLADVFALYVRAHGFHWNVEGEDFAQYHELFQTIYEDVYGSIDALAENVRKLDGKAPASLAQLTEMTDLSETGDDATAPGALARQLLEMNDKVLEGLNAAFKIANDEDEQGIANFLSERIDMHQKWRWQLSASLSKTSSEGNDMSEEMDSMDAQKAILGAPERCDNCGGEEFEPYTTGLLGGTFTFPMCTNCEQVSKPTHWPKKDAAVKVANSIGVALLKLKNGDIDGAGSTIASLDTAVREIVADRPYNLLVRRQCPDCREGLGDSVSQHFRPTTGTAGAIHCPHCGARHHISDLAESLDLSSRREQEDDRCRQCGGEGVAYPPLDIIGEDYFDDEGEECDECGGTGYYSLKNNPEFKRASVKTALENPFDGYGRPFSEDPLNPNMDPAYFGDNPASDTKPYAGPTSYSINTTGPYMPPNSGMEDPGQNVGPYSPPGYAEDMVGAEMALQSIAKTYEAWNSETEWFDGTSDSIYRRITVAREIQKTADKATSHLIEQQIKTLEKVANEFADSSLAEYMSSVPGGTVAMEYDDLTDGGLVDVTSFLSTEAHKYIEEVNSYDWERFAKEAPRMWVSAKAKDNPGILSNERQTREAAVDYVKSKTMVLMDPVLRADIIDNFVNDVERARRSHAVVAKREAAAEAARKAEFERRQQQRIAAELSELEYGDDDTLFPGQTVTGTNDPFDFGADDGSALYREAASIADSHRNRNWSSFCVEGARDWFFSNDTGKHSIYRYADTTRYAAKQYVEDETSLVKDPTLKNEIKRAFLESVDYLREEWLDKQAAAEDEDEGNLDILSQYYDDETLW